MEYAESLTRGMYEPQKTLLGVDYEHIAPQGAPGSLQGLGADEQKPGALFVRLVNPTELDKTRESMIELIKGYYDGVDWLNLDLWRKTDRGNINQFLRRYIMSARTKSRAVTTQNLDAWVTEFSAKYPDMRHEDTTDWFRAFLESYHAGMVDNVIYKPWTYKPDEPIDTFAKTVGATMSAGVESGFNKVLVAGSLVALLYLLGKTYIIKKV